MSEIRWRPAWGGQRLLVGASVLAAGLCIAGTWLAGRLAFEERRLAAITSTERYSSVVGPASPRPPRDFVRSFLPVKYQRVVRAVSLVGLDAQMGGVPEGSLTHFDFGNLAYFPELVELSVLGRMDERQLLSLNGLANLEELTLETDQASDAVVCHLTAICPKITTLVLRSGSATDISVPCICRLRKLEYLYLQGTKMSARALLGLRALSSLRAVFTDPDEGAVTWPRNGKPAAVSSD